jgi:hypothetical protein
MYNTVISDGENVSYGNVCDGENVSYGIIIFHVNFLSSHWLRSVCQFSLSHGRG